MFMASQLSGTLNNLTVHLCPRQCKNGNLTKLQVITKEKVYFIGSNSIKRFWESLPHSYVALFIDLLGNDTAAPRGARVEEALLRVCSKALNSKAQRQLQHLFHDYYEVSSDT